MDKKEVNEGKISKNFIFFDFRDFSFHNYGQMFPKWNTDKPSAANDTSLNCSPDTDAAIQDALEEIIRDLSGKEIEENDIKLFADADNNNFNEFTSWLSKTKEITEYGKYIKNNIKNFASKKHKESDELCNKVFESLFTPANFQIFRENIEERIIPFLKKEGISDNDTNKKKYILKYLNILLKTIPQPWNALASGAILTFIMKLAQDSKVIGKQDNEFIEYMHPGIYIKDMWNYIKEMSNIKNSGNELPSEYADIVKDIQFYLEYALIMNAPGEWKPTVPKIDNAPPSQVSMIAFPLLDNGFFRGYFYLLSSCPGQISAQYEPNILKQYEKKCLYFVDSLRVAHETEMMDILFREKKGGDDGTEDKAERDIYKRILKNLHYIQEVSLGSLWMIDSEKITQSYVTGYGRYFKEKPKEDGTPGIYWYREYESYENFINTKRNNTASGAINIKNEEEKLATIVNGLYRTNREDFQKGYPKYEVLYDDFNSQYIQPSSSGSYYKQETLGIKWRLTLPVVRRGDLKAIYFFYYRDPIVISSGKYTNLSKIEGNILQKEIFGLRAKQIMKFFSAIEAYEERKFEIIKHGAKTARATIISGSVSHNIGSHVLSSINDEVIKDRRPDVERLISYVQQRMDYIAGVTSDYPLWSEPTFFFLDLLEGFFQQGLLLDYITNDDGVPGEKIEFHVKYKDSPHVYSRARIVQLEKDDNGELEIPFFGSKEEINQKIITYQNEGYKIKNESIEKYAFKKCNNGSVEDFIVSIPGGIIGRHAFYALLENFMRNGAKHNKEKGGNYEVYIEVTEEDHEKYRAVNLYDNWSKKDGLVKDIQGKLKKPIVQNDGSPTPGDWGIQEMKISADYLASPHITERVEDGTVSEEYFVYEDKKESRKYRIWAFETTERSNKLSYKFILQKSILVAAADFNGHPQREGDLSKGVVIKSISDNEDLSKLVKEFSPQLLIIRPPEDEVKLSSLLKHLKENHVSFPSRVLVCGDNEDKIDKINGKVSNTQGIPPRRYLAGNWLKPENSDWEIFIINVYKEWIRRLAGLEKPKVLNLAIYFDKDKESKAVVRWQKVVGDVDQYGLKEIVNIVLLNKDDNLNTEVTAKLNDKENILVFDNHLSLDRAISNSRTNITSKVRHLHAMGTKELFKCKSIFDIMQNFPQGFSGMYSLLLLLESAIAKCLIIDERVIRTIVGSVADKKIIPNDKCSYLEMAGCYIPIHMLIESGKYLCLLKDEKFNNLIPKHNNTIEVENSSLICVKDCNSNTQKNFDYIIVHKSMLDTLKKDISLDIHKFIDSLYKLSPRVIVTSGKGKRQTRERNDEIDSKTSGFLEYSILKQFTITDLSKYHLNRIIYSING